MYSANTTEGSGVDRAEQTHNFKTRRDDKCVSSIRHSRWGILLKKQNQNQKLPKHK